jgi:hypothetical protein
VHKTGRDTRTAYPHATRNTLITLLGLADVSAPVSISTSVPEPGDLEFVSENSPLRLHVMRRTILNCPRLSYPDPNGDR